MHLPRGLPVFTLLLASAGSGCGDDVIDLPAVGLVLPNPSSPCGAGQPQCLLATPDADCWGVAIDSSCERAAWRCPQGMILAAQCRAIGCSPVSDTICLPGRSGAACGIEPAVARCSDEGQWLCPEGTIQFTSCGCLGDEPGAPCSEG